MAKRDKKVKAEEQARQLTPKEIRLKARQREHNRKLYLGTGIAVGLAALLILIGALVAFIVVPGRSYASVGDQSISTRDFWKRMRLEKNSLQNQLFQLQQLEQQLGGGDNSFFANQINQIQSTLSSPFALASQTLNQVLEEQIIALEAISRSITVSDEEVEQALREEIANSQGLLSEAQATATSEANADATATAQIAPTTAVSESAELTTTTTVSETTPAASAEITGTETISANEAVSASAPIDVSSEIVPTATTEPLPTRAIITDTAYSDGIKRLEENLQSVASLTLNDYRAIIRTRLLREKLQEAIGQEVTTTEEQVRARHILLREIAPTPVITDTANITPTATATPLPPEAPTPTATPAPRTLAQAQTQAAELRQRLTNGEDFAALAQQYSDDLGSGQNGGELGWFSKGMMVPEFEEQAFKLEPGQISEPFTSTFGVHILQVEEKDANRPKDEQKLSQERQQAYDTWLQQQLAGPDVKRPGDLLANLPRDLR
jgi:parvulin-like peptidyl-prolyl isomerase